MTSKVVFLSCLMFSILMGTAESPPKELLGDWSLNLKSGETAWLSVNEEEAIPSVAMAVNVGSIKPLKGVVVKNGEIHIPLKIFRRGGKWPTNDLTLVDRHITDTRLKSVSIISRQSPRPRQTS